MLSLYRFLDRLCLILNKIITFVVLALVAIITVINVAQIIGRYAFFYSLPWSEELSIYIFFWLIMLGGVYCVRDDVELRIDVLNPKNPKTARALKIVQESLSLFIIAVFFLSSLMHVRHAMNFRQLSSSMQFSMAFVYMIIPVGFLLMALEKALVLTRVIVMPGKKD